MQFHLDVRILLQILRTHREEVTKWTKEESLGGTPNGKASWWKEKAPIMQVAECIALSTIRLPPQSRNSECAAALDGIFPSAAEDKFLRESEFDGREFRDGKTWAMGFPRGNYLPPLKVRLPRDWKPSDVTGCPESRLTIAGRCPCCAAVIKRDQEMIP